MKTFTKCFIFGANGYEEITYAELTERAQADVSYKQRRFIPLHGMLMEVGETAYKDYYKGVRRQKYLTEESIRTGELSFEALDTDELAGDSTLVDPAPSPEDTVAQKMMIEAMRVGMAQLDRDEVELITAVYFLGKSERSLANDLNITQPAVRKRIQKVLVKLRSLMKI